MLAFANPGMVIKANRKLRYPIQRKLGSVLYNFECRVLFDLPVWDVNGTPKAFHRDTRDKLNLQENGDLIDLEFVVKCERLGLQILEVPIVSMTRHGGESTTNYSSAFKMYWGALMMRLSGGTNHSEGPTKMTSARAEREALWSLHNDEFRDPAEVVSYWQEARRIEPKLLEWETHGRWWEILAELRITLLVTREYEHLVLAMCADETGPTISVMRIPHPSGLTIDRDRGVVHIAVTRNPNQIFDLMPVQGLKPRLDMQGADLEGKLLVPVRTRFLPGCLYIHDLAMVGAELHANSVGENAVVKLDRLGGCSRVWWPKCIETDNGPIFGRNHLQLNSIAAGDDDR